MKFASTIIALWLLISTAFAAQRRAFGPLSFGMSPEEVERVKGNLGVTLTGAEVRKQLIGTERKGKLEEKDQAMSFAFSYSYIPVNKVQRLREVRFESSIESDDDFGTKGREAWEQLRDIALSKFGNSEKKEEFPPVALFAGNRSGLVTDHWERGGMHMILSITRPRIAPGTGPKYVIALVVYDLKQAP